MVQMPKREWRGLGFVLYFRAVSQNALAWVRFVISRTGRLLVVFFGSWVASLYLGATAALIEIVRCFLLGRFADLDVVHHRLGSGGLGHSSGRSFVLNDFGGTFPVRNPPLDTHFEAVFADLRFGQLGADRRLDILILLRTGPRRRGSL